MTRTKIRPPKFQQAPVDDVNVYIDDDNWAMQQKVDGMRAQLVANHGDLWIRSGGGGPIKSTTATPVAEMIVTWARHAGLDRDDLDLIIDGEIIAKGGVGTWNIFDIAHHRDGDDQLLDENEPFIARINHLRTLMGELPSEDWIRVLPTASTPDEKLRLWSQIEAANVEGAVVKRKDALYEWDTRTDNMLKVKRTHTIDCVVLERGPGNGRNGEGNWLRLGLNKKNGSLYEVGRCSTIGKPHAEPGDVVEVKYLYAGKGGRLVQPTHLRTRDDKYPNECTTAQLQFVSKKVVTEL